jgi:hypothetical protein
MTASATAIAQQTVESARAEAERLDAASAARRAEAEEDFTLALNARRTESHQTITEQERNASVDATARIRAATEHATALVTSANEHAATTVARAAAESHQRVAEADAAVASLTDLRSQLLGQLGILGAHLDQVRTLVSQAGPIVTPPEQEAGRPTTENFPPDPTGRPTPPPGFDPEASVWAPPQQQPFIPPSAQLSAADEGQDAAAAPAESIAAPEPINSEVVDPAVAGPAVADPAVPDPAVADPAVPDPAATEPAASATAAEDPRSDEADAVTEPRRQTRSPRETTARISGPVST